MSTSPRTLAETQKLDAESIARLIDQYHSSGALYHALGNNVLVKICGYSPPGSSNKTKHESLKEAILRTIGGGEGAEHPHHLQFAEQLRQRSLTGQAQVLVLRGSADAGKTETLKQIVAYYSTLEVLPALVADSRKRDSARPLGSARNALPLFRDSSLVAQRLSAAMTLLQAFGSVSLSEKRVFSPSVMQHVCLKFQNDASLAHGGVGAAPARHGHLAGCRVQALLPELLSPSLKDAPLMLQCMLALHKEHSQLLPSALVEQQFQTVKDQQHALSLDFHEEWEHLQRTLIEHGGLRSSHCDELMRVAAVVTLLQSVSVLGTESAALSSATKGHVSLAEELLELPAGSLAGVLLKKPDERIGRPAGSTTDCRAAETRQLLDLLVTELLSRALSRLLDELALDIAPFDLSDNVFLDQGFVHLVDPVGWEKQPIPGSPHVTGNSMARLQRHWVEEKLSALFVEKAFRDELRRYAAEGVQLEGVAVPDWAANGAALDSDQWGLFALVEELAAAPRAEDRLLLDKLREREREREAHSELDDHGAESAASCVRSLSGGAAKRGGAGNFSVRHSFAESVYEANNALTHQRVALSGAALYVLRTSALSLVSSVSSSALSSSAEKSGASAASLSVAASAAGGAANKRGRDVREKEKHVGAWQRLRQNAQRVFAYLHSAPAHAFCLCISSSAALSATALDCEALALSGLISMTQKGFSFVQNYHEFFNNYRAVLPFEHATLPLCVGEDEEVEDVRVLCQQLLQECVHTLRVAESLAEPPAVSLSACVAFGHTVILMRERAGAAMERERRRESARRLRAALVLQRVLRMARHRGAYLSLRHAVIALQAMQRQKASRRTFLTLRNAAVRVKNVLRVLTLSRRFRALRCAVQVLKQRLLGPMAQRMRYKRLQRATLALRHLARGTLSRRAAQNVLRAVLTLQRSAIAFLRRRRSEREREKATRAIQRIYRGHYARTDPRITRLIQILLFRKEQRRANKVVRALQALWRRRLVAKRFREIERATVTLQRWLSTQRLRARFCLAQRLVRWLQSIARRESAIRSVHAMRVNEMLREEQRVLATLFAQESLPLRSRRLGECRAGSGFFRHDERKFDRLLAHYDLCVDLSLCYPQGWLPTLLQFCEQLYAREKREITTIAVGAQHTLLLDDRCALYSFGWGDLGQLGHASRQALPAPRVLESLHKTLLSSASDDVAAQASHSAAHSAHSYNNLSLSGVSSSLTLQASLSPAVRVRQVVCGRDHSLLLTALGRVFSWGDNRRGQLGHSHFETISTPRLVSLTHNAPTQQRRVTLVAAGAAHSLCLTEAGVLYTWGAGECLGRGVSERDAAAENVRRSSSSLSRDHKQRVGVAVGAKPSKTTLSTVADDNVAVYKVDRVRNVVDCSEPHTLPFFVRKKVQFALAGETHVVVFCGADMLTWGLNAHGQLGIGSTMDCALPTKVDFPRAFNEKDLLTAKISTGGRHMSMLFKGQLWMWGWNKFGQCGNGTTENVLSPTRVALSESAPAGHSPASVLSVTLCWRSTLALSSSHEVLGWGVLNALPPLTLDAVRESDSSEHSTALFQREGEPFALSLTPTALALSPAQRALFGKHCVSVSSSSSPSLSLACVDVEAFHALLVAPLDALPTAAAASLPRKATRVASSTLVNKSVAALSRTDASAVGERATETDKDREREKALKTLRRTRPRSNNAMIKEREQAQRDELTQRLREEVGRLSLRKLETSDNGAKNDALSAPHRGAEKKHDATAKSESLSPSRSVVVPATPHKQWELKEDALRTLFSPTQCSSIKQRRLEREIERGGGGGAGAERESNNKPSAAAAARSPGRERERERDGEDSLFMSPLRTLPAHHLSLSLGGRGASPSPAGTPSRSERSFLQAFLHRDDHGNKDSSSSAVKQKERERVRERTSSPPPPPPPLLHTQQQQQAKSRVSSLPLSSSLSVNARRVDRETQREPAATPVRGAAMERERDSAASTTASGVRPKRASASHMMLDESLSFRAQMHELGLLRHSHSPDAKAKSNRDEHATAESPAPPIDKLKREIDKLRGWR